jgi:hypothetical protein
MGMFRRKLVVTPMLIAMALLALGLPASARAIYEQNTSQACCAAQTCCAKQGQCAPDDNAGQACCPDGEALAAECCPVTAADQAQCSEECKEECGEEPCVPAQRCGTGALGALGCCP